MQRFVFHAHLHSPVTTEKQKQDNEAGVLHIVKRLEQIIELQPMMRLARIERHRIGPIVDGKQRYWYDAYMDSGAREFPSDWSVLDSPQKVMVGKNLD